MQITLLAYALVSAFYGLDKIHILYFVIHNLLSLHLLSAFFFRVFSSSMTLSWPIRKTNVACVARELAVISLFEMIRHLGFFFCLSVCVSIAIFSIFFSFVHVFSGFLVSTDVDLIVQCSHTKWFALRDSAEALRMKKAKTVLKSQEWLLDFLHLYSFYQVMLLEKY